MYQYTRIFAVINIIPKGHNLAGKLNTQLAIELWKNIPIEALATAAGVLWRTTP